MKNSNFIGKFVATILLAAAFFIVSCNKSDDKDDLTDTDADTSDTSITDTDSNDTTPDIGDSADDSDDTTPESPDSTPDNGDSSDDSDEPAADTDTDTEPEPTDDTDTTDDTDNTDTDFEKETEGCTMIEVPKITMGGTHADEINGYFSPAMGESAIDIIRIYLMGEIKAGTYELGTGLNDNYAQCQQCVMVWVDAELATAKEYYFRTAGTLTITKVETVEEIERTSGTINNLIMKQVEPLNDYLGDFGFISKGKCVAAKLVEWDTTGDPGY